jgi:predicted nucleic acid-binding protein
MRVLFDTNVIIDFLAQREHFYQNSREILGMLPSKKLEGIISAGSVTDIYYIIRKYFQDSPKALDSIINITNVLKLVDTKADDIRTAIGLGFSDFEDAVICATAMRENAGYIICTSQYEI